MPKINIDKINDEFFLNLKGAESASSEARTRNSPYKIVVADDDREVHQVTEMIFKGFTFEGIPLEIINTYSAAETIEIFKTRNDIAILFLDVVMEKSCSGLDVVRILRDEIKNASTRIILRTGQPGEAPEEDVIRDYDINDYRLKTELTSNRLKTTLYSALRNYRDIRILEKHKTGLEKIIKTTSKLFENNTLRDFLNSMLEELSNFQLDSPEMLFVRGAEYPSANGILSVRERNRNVIVAATGKFEGYVGMNIEEIQELSYLKEWISCEELNDEFIHQINEGFIIENRGKSKQNNFIFIDGVAETFDFELVHLFLANFSVSLDNFILNNMLNTTQKDMIIALGETLESHFQENGNHVKRIAEMMYRFALKNKASMSEAEMIKVASSMHDLGKIAIPDSTLKKPGKLTDEEFEIIKTHTVYGHNILNKSDMPILKIAAEIALNHHEKYDGSGYPKGIPGENIPILARMMAIVDVFDAMTHKRVYKEAISVDETMEYLVSNKEKHFDPILVDLFAENLKYIVFGEDGIGLRERT
ncbi:MAG: DUF3369 domain-containing protein [Clostridia bacterium]|nr:DUF3369 domain-containing protein [Clostridia bacterium]